MSADDHADVFIEVYSDAICPWCYVGKARLDKALTMVDPTLRVSVVWKAFQLNPNMPEDGMDRVEYLTRKFGTADISPMQDRLNAAGNPDGIQFNFSLMRVVPNTFKAHRLLWFAHTRNVQDAVASALFKAYFSEGLDIGATDVLIAAAAGAGLSESEIRSFLEGDLGTAEVQSELETAAELGIHSVPTFVINGRVTASGAIAAAELKKVIENAPDFVGAQ